MTERLQRESEPINFDKMQRQYENAFFIGDSESIFSKINADRMQIRPGEQTLDREHHIRDLITEFFGQLKETVDTPPEGVESSTRFRRPHSDLRTIFGDVLDIGTDQSTTQDKFPRSQLYLMQLALRDVEGEAIYDRRDHLLQAQLDSAKEAFKRSQRLHPEDQEENREGFQARLDQLSQRPIEKYEITFQTTSTYDRYDPSVGVVIISSITGWQAFPLIYEGREKIILSDRPLWGCREETVEGSKEPFIFSGMTPEEFSGTNWAKVLFALIDRAEFEQ